MTSVSDLSSRQSTPCLVVTIPLERLPSFYFDAGSAEDEQRLRAWLGGPAQLGQRIEDGVRFLLDWLDEPTAAA
jgi:hypothetical protein